MKGVCQKSVLEMTLRKAADMRRMQILNGTEVYDMKMMTLAIGFK